VPRTIELKTEADHLRLV